MDSVGEGEGVIRRLEKALAIVEEEKKKEARDVRLIIAQFQFLQKNDDEAKVWFAKYRELSPKKYDVEGYIRTPLSRMKLFGTDEQMMVVVPTVKVKEMVVVVV
ncbi:hypothetical protein HanRHA438_Chr05g0219931 [Helianthus annuus]|uniref:Uncharacterized protein n=1 Tax=Helianthus annuus TaxID=4232 RepID=A0A251UN88_HELAN|nr:hypothetical protein HanXRQr2_Chr05g0210291 [Helianthus annuus]KAJ0569937.1 hypothetical protein HanHA300_Chr05g0172321 [Helianthus annuus]KAJ0576618.1 hypothetical protein HanIR_Chr05g0226421 [Helianthus annuus]KAJ0584266.1 hypothetical protein HanHA89_Chr05g0186571 [Helianthus annuus]KAJ0746902.1 hypothetical protein HanOQP8_Chr05g0183221 [Helianthus annuus]